MLRSRAASRIINFFIKEGQVNARLEDASLLVPLRQAVFGVQKLANASMIEPEIKEYVKIRASQINGCAFCLSMHWRDSLKMGLRPDKLATLGAWEETGWYTPRERAALAWTEALTNLNHHAVTDDLYEACREVFSDEEMVELTTMIVAINSWNRISVGFGTQPEAFTLSEVQ